MLLKSSADGLNFFAIVIAELVFDLLQSFAHCLRNEKPREGYRDNTDYRKDYKSRLQTETVEQRREEQTYNKIGNPYE